MIHLLQSFPKRPKLGQAAIHDGFTKFFLGLEIVIDIAKWDTGRLRDIGETCFSEPLSISQLRRRLGQPRPLIRLRFRNNIS